MDATPNIVLIMCDQLNASVINGFNGVIKVPNIETLASNGVVFDKAYCQTPLCSPSRASIVTGLYPHGHGILENVMRIDYPTIASFCPKTEEGITNSDITTEKLLDNSGYKTAHYGNWHLSGEMLYYYPDMYREFYEYKNDVVHIFSKIDDSDVNDIMNWYGWRLPVEVSDAVKICSNRLNIKWKQLPLSDFYTKIGRLKMKPEDMFDYKVADRSIKFINNNHESSFMLTCSFNLPHDPNVIPSPYYEEVDPNSIDCNVKSFCDNYFSKELSKEVPSLMGNEFLKEFLRVYYASVLFIDDQIGRIINALEEKGILDNTIIVFLSDHGDMAGGHGMFWKSTSSFYDEISRVPLIIRYPLALSPSIYKYPVELIDLMPTLLNLVGIRVPEGIHGKSLIPYIDGKVNGFEKVAISERIKWNDAHIRKFYNTSERSFMLRTEEWKYFIYPDGKEFLFNLESDPQEYINLAEIKTYLHIKKEIKKILKERLWTTGYKVSI